MEIYAVNSHKRLPAILYEELLEVIDEAYRERIARYRFWEDRQRSLLGQVLVRYAIIKNFYLANDEIKIIRNTYGKPFISGIGGIYFNVSHSGDWVVFVINTENVGIDVQEVTDIKVSIAEHFFSREENEFLAALGKEEKLSGFYNMWSLKEAYIKALGLGFTMPLNSFTVIRTSEGFEVKCTKERKFYLKQYPIDNGYKLSVCSKENNFCHVIKNLTIDDIRRAFVSLDF
jgi:4'-phosphopantetheinyl transferase